VSTTSTKRKGRAESLKKEHHDYANDFINYEFDEYDFDSHEYQPAKVVLVDSSKKVLQDVVRHSGTGTSSNNNINDYISNSRHYANAYGFTNTSKELQQKTQHVLASRSNDNRPFVSPTLFNDNNVENDSYSDDEDQSFSYDSHILEDQEEEDSYSICDDYSSDDEDDDDEDDEEDNNNNCFNWNDNDNMELNHQSNNNVNYRMYADSSKIRGCYDITSQQKNLNYIYNDQINFYPEDEMMIDLYLILKSSNAPLILYDKMIDYLQRHKHKLSNLTSTTNMNSKSLKRRKEFLNYWTNRLYQNNTQFLQPRISKPIKLSQNNETLITTFSLKEMILNMVCNKHYFKPANLLLDPKNPWNDDDLNKDYYADVNSGNWFYKAKQLYCTNDKLDILMPFCFFIDGLKLDKFGKITLEAVLTCCLWYKRKARNRATSWWLQGFIQDHGLYRDNETPYDQKDKYQDYHIMLEHILKEFAEIRDAGGIKMTLDFECNGEKYTHIVAAKPCIMFIIGDAKGNDMLCCRMGSYTSLKMGGFCRDCDISPQNTDDPCTDVNGLKCSWIDLNIINTTNDDDLKNNLSFYPIKRNCFHYLPMGDNIRNIYGSTPVEILHSILLGLCEYISDGITSKFSNDAMTVINYTIIGIVKNNSRQSYREMPNVHHFRNGIGKATSLKAVDRLARIFVFWLALNNSFCIEALTQCRMKKPNQRQFYSIEDINDFKKVLEDTIFFYYWCKKPRFKKSEIDQNINGSDSPALKRIKAFLQDFKKNIVRPGNNLKTPKFHQMLHIPEYISLFGAPSNVDGSRGEHHGKTLIKDNAKNTNKQRDTMNFDIARRLAEDKLVDQLSILYFNSNNKWPSKHCNERDLIENNLFDDDDDNDDHIDLLYVDETRDHKVLPAYDFGYNRELEEDSQGNQIQCYKLQVKWRKKTPIDCYPDHIKQNLMNRLFIGPAHDGGIIIPFDNGDRDSCFVNGYTRYRLNKDSFFRCHPHYRGQGKWFDWGLFEWSDYEDLIPCKIYMILDLSDSNIIYSDNDMPRNVINEDEQFILQKEKYCIVETCTSDVFEMDEDDPRRKYYLNSKMIKRYLVDMSEYDHNMRELWIVPLLALKKTCYVIEDQNYIVGNTLQSKYLKQHLKFKECDNPSITLVEGCQNWSKAFLPDNDS
jgi:hypothetical protein